MNEVRWKIAYESSFEYLPESDGVYLICCKCSDGNNIVIYTGQSNNIKKRIYQHWGDNEKEEIRHIIIKYRNSIFVLYTLFDGRRLDGVENFLFNYYKPQLSDKTPDANPIPIQVPNIVSKGRVKFY